jgi:hypothetical protein
VLIPVFLDLVDNRPQNVGLQESFSLPMSAPPYNWRTNSGFALQNLQMRVRYQD